MTRNRCAPPAGLAANTKTADTTAMEANKAVATLFLRVVMRILLNYYDK